MKYDALQESFISGEISRRAQGHVGSDAYKTGLAAARNMVITQLGTASSRAGGALVTDKVQSAVFAGPVETFGLEGSPWGDVTAAVSGTTLRLYNRWGPVAVSGWQDLGDFFSSNSGSVGMLWTDPERRELVLDPSRPANSVQFAVNAALLGVGNKGELHFYFSGNGLRVQGYKNGIVQFDVTPVAGYNKIEFTLANVTSVLFSTLGGPTGATAWGFGLVGKNNGTNLPVYDVAVAGMSVSPGLRCTAFWDKAHGDYYMIFSGPGMLPLRVQAQSIYALFVSVDFLWGAFSLGLGGSFAAMTTTPSWLVAGAVISVLAYQNRLWFGLNDKYGTIIATRIGLRDDDYAELVGGGLTSAGDRFVVAPGHTILAAVGAGQTVVTARIGAHGEGSDRDTFNIVSPAGANLLRGDATNPGDFTVKVPGGGIYGSDSAWVVITFTNPLAAGTILINRVSGAATDSLDLNIAQPTGPVGWMNELRGMLLGTTRGEYNLTPAPLAVDPVSGSALEIVKHSAHGADIAVNAVPAVDKILFVPRGRTRIRMTGELILTNGGLVSPDVSILGADLLKKRIRDMAVLKSPVTRVVVALDDGTGAIALVNEDNKALAWSKFVLPAPYDIYSVSSTDTPLGSELWVGTSAGALLVFGNVDSDPNPRLHSSADSVSATAPAVVSPITEPTLPALDGWLRLPVGATAVYGFLPPEWVGRSVYVLVNGVPAAGAPFVAVAAGAYAQVTLQAIVPPTWLDAAGVLQQTVLTAGIKFPSHGFTTLAQEGGNPAGSAQGYKSRAPQLYLRLVDSYVPLIGGFRGVPEREPGDAVDLQASRITGDVRATQLGFDRARQLVVEMDLPLRFEVSTIFGGTAVNST